jgi:N-acetylglucosamine kinase-like BadF-type ATPase
MSDKRRYTGLSVSQVESGLMPDELTYQGKLRAAMSGAVAEADVAAVVKQITDGAKSGDPKAQKMFFEYLVGVKNAPTKISIHNHYPDTIAAGKSIEERAREARAQTLAARRNGHPIGIGNGDDNDN